MFASCDAYAHAWVSSRGASLPQPEPYYRHYIPLQALSADDFSALSYDPFNTEPNPPNNSLAVSLGLNLLEICAQAKLNKSETLLVRLVYAEGATQKEVAKTLSVSQQAASKRLKVLHRKIKRSL